VLSLGPSSYAIQQTYKSGLDREPPKSSLSIVCWGLFYFFPLPGGEVTRVRVVAVGQVQVREWKVEVRRVVLRDFMRLMSMR
jgi:hypothetical protein